MRQAVKEPEVVNSPSSRPPLVALSLRPLISRILDWRARLPVETEPK